MSERIYEAKLNSEVYSILEANKCEQFKYLISKIILGLDLLCRGGIVHCDFKSENILVEMDLPNRCVKSVKIIDFGTSFDFGLVNSKVDVTTPEYLPPEVLEYIESRKTNMVNQRSQKQSLQAKLSSWSIDVWSLGIIVLEMIVGFPVWMSYRGQIVRDERQSSSITTGLFGVQGRLPTKIAKLQIKVASDLPKFLKKLKGSGLCLNQLYDNNLFINFIYDILRLKPKDRMAPCELLYH